jgi:RimJ/RimL family protein N-acetyltransferase
MGVASTIMQEVSNYLHEKGIKKIFILIESQNSSMLKVAKKAGFKEIGEIKYLKIGKLALYRRKGKIKNFIP